MRSPHSAVGDGSRETDGQIPTVSGVELRLWAGYPMMGPQEPLEEEGASGIR